MKFVDDDDAHSDKCFEKLQSLYIVSNYKRYQTDEFCSRRLKTGRDVVDLMSRESLFQTEIAATMKARSPMEERQHTFSQIS